MASVSFVSDMPGRSKRDYVARVVENDMAECAKVSRQWGYDYWDGDRKYGFGGYVYDGRWQPVAEHIAAYYGLKAGDKVLDVGCGKGYLLYDLAEVVPGLDVTGIDISAYAVENAKDEIKRFLRVGTCTELPFENASFDLVYSVNTLHNLHVFDLMAALKEIQRVSRRHRFICEESYRNEREKSAVLYWALTCETFFTPDEWRWFHKMAGYEGDVDFIFFE